MSCNAGAGKTAAVVDVALANAEVFGLLANIEQLPRWAPRLFHGLEVGRDGWSAYSPWGELKLELTADAATASIDLEVRIGRELRGTFSFWVERGSAAGTRVRLMSFPESEGLGPNEVLGAIYLGLCAELPEIGRVLEGRWTRPGAREGMVEDAA